MFDHNSKCTWEGGTYTELIGEYLLSKLDSYAIDGRCHGHFLTALVEGDLFTVFAHGDDENVAKLPYLTKYIHNQMPGNCFGNKARVEHWLNTGGLKGQGYVDHNGHWLKSEVQRATPQGN